MNVGGLGRYPHCIHSLHWRAPAGDDCKSAIQIPRGLRDLRYHPLGTLRIESVLCSGSTHEQNNMGLPQCGHRIGTGKPCCREIFRIYLGWRNHKLEQPIAWQLTEMNTTHQEIDVGGIAHGLTAKKHNARAAAALPFDPAGNRYYSPSHTDDQIRKRWFQFRSTLTAQAH